MDNVTKYLFELRDKVDTLEFEVDGEERDVLVGVSRREINDNNKIKKGGIRTVLTTYPPIIAWIDGAMYVTAMTKY